MGQGFVTDLFFTPSEDQYESVDRLTIVSGKGIEGSRHFGGHERQVLFLSKEDLSFFGYRPGDWREQITVDLPGLQQLKEGTLVQVGPVRFEVEQDCAPCSSLAKRLGQDPVAFVHRTLGRRGMFLKPVSDGVVKVGDSIEVVQP